MVLYSAFIGHITRVLTAQETPIFRRLAREHRCKCWVIDLLELSGFEPWCVGAGTEWMRIFRSNGGMETIVATTMPAARMAATAMGFGAGIKLTVVGSKDEVRSRLAAVWSS
jgi:hypothetical protein